MAGRRAVRDVMTRDQWADQVAALDRPHAGVPPAKEPISAARIVEAALAVVAEEGYDALTMRRVAARLGTGPASLYAHVRNKSELDALLLGELLSRVHLPVPDPARWQDQFLDVCRQVRNQFVRYPGIARIALGAVPHGLEPLRVAEGMLTLLLAGGVAPQSAAWASDAAFLYVTGYCLDTAAAHRPDTDTDGRAVDRAEIAERLRMLPASRFPNTVKHAAELTAGEEGDRFDFSLQAMLRGIA